MVALLRGLVRAGGGVAPPSTIHVHPVTLPTAAAGGRPTGCARGRKLVHAAAAAVGLPSASVGRGSARVVVVGAAAGTRAGDAQTVTIAVRPGRAVEVLPPVGAGGGGVGAAAAAAPMAEALLPEAR